MTSVFSILGNGACYVDGILLCIHNLGNSFLAFASNCPFTIMRDNMLIVFTHSDLAF